MSTTERDGELSSWRARDPQGFEKWQRAQIEAAQRRPIGSQSVPIVEKERFMSGWDPEKDEDRRSLDRDTLKRHEVWINEHTEKIAVLTSNYTWIKSTLEEIQAMVSTASDRIVRVEEYITRGICPDIEEIKHREGERAKQGYQSGESKRDRTLVVVSLVIALLVGVGGWFF